MSAHPLSRQWFPVFEKASLFKLEVGSLHVFVRDLNIPSPFISGRSLPSAFPGRDWKPIPGLSIIRCTTRIIPQDQRIISPPLNVRQYRNRLKAWIVLQNIREWRASPQSLTCCRSVLPSLWCPTFPCTKGCCCICLPNSRGHAVWCMWCYLLLRFILTKRLFQCIIEMVYDLLLPM
jgi:hypothetical protein